MNIDFYFQSWMADKEEVQRVDQILRIRNKLDEIPDVPDVIQEKLRKHIEVGTKCMERR